VVVVVADFHYDVISCKLARRGVLHGAADEASGTGGVQHGGLGGRGNPVGLTSILDRWQFFQFLL